MAVVDDDVRRIIQVDSTVIPDIDPFIADALVLVENVIGSTRVSARTYDIVTMYLAAHLVMITQGQIQSEKVKSLQTQYATLLDKGLGITHWGTVAMTMDTSGRLAAFNTRLVSGGGLKQFFWAGEA